MQITSTPHTSGLKEAFLRHFEKLPRSSEAVQLIRQEAMNRFEQLGLPTSKNEEYRYTPISRALEKNFSADEATPAYLLSQESKETIRQQLPKNLPANILVFVNGQWIEDLSSIVTPSENLVIKPFSQALSENPDLIEAYFSRQADFRQDAFVALNTALAEEGLFVYVPLGKVVEEPILAYFITDTTQGKVMTQARNLYIAGENSQLTVVESFSSLGSLPAYQNVVTEVVLAQHATVHYQKLQTDGGQAYHTGTTQVLQTAQSLFNATTISLAGAMIRNNLNIALDAEHCEAHMYGLYALDRKTHVDNHTIVDHRQPNCFSNELYKGIMDDQSRGVFNGKIYVRPGAQKTNAFQSNKNILLTDEASVDTKPQLEIWADDVKCSHGATTGQIDPEQLFYLRTRGLSMKQARALLLKAFASDVIQHIKVEPLKEQIGQMIVTRLEKDM